MSPRVETTVAMPILPNSSSQLRAASHGVMRGLASRQCAYDVHPPAPKVLALCPELARPGRARRISSR